MYKMTDKENSISDSSGKPETELNAEDNVNDNKNETSFDTG